MTAPRFATGPPLVFSGQRLVRRLDALGYDVMLRPKMATA
jgi:hypothetical protein